MEQMNQTMQQLFDRKSVRVFEDKPIPEDIKQAILDSAIQAPTAGNQVLYTIIDVQDQKLKDKLAVTCDNQPFIATAPLVLVFLADCRRWWLAYKAAGVENCREPGVGDMLLACSDAVIAAQNTVVAAESFGIGSCYIGDCLENIEAHTKLLGLAPWLLPVCMAVYGYPTQQQKERQKPTRFATRHIVHVDGYKQPDEGTLREMFSEIHPEPTFDFDRYVTAFCNRKYMSDFSAEMTRSVAEYIKQYEPFDKG